MLFRSNFKRVRLFVKNQTLTDVSYDRTLNMSLPPLIKQLNCGSRFFWICRSTTNNKTQNAAQQLQVHNNRHLYRSSQYHIRHSTRSSSSSNNNRSLNNGRFVDSNHHPRISYGNALVMGSSGVLGQCIQQYLQEQLHMNVLGADIVDVKVPMNNNIDDDETKQPDRKSTRLNSSHSIASRMPSSA